jgi:hypothetical protein
MNEHIVTGCSDCPMFWSNMDDRYGWETNCLHPNFNLKEIVQEIDVQDDGTPITPQNCPLNKSSITIIKKND